MRITFDQYFSEIANIVARRSTCWKYNVGAVVVSNDKLLSTGYNGTASGCAHCADVGPRDRAAHREWSREHEIHAEWNAIILAAAQIQRARAKGEIVTLYTTLAPCLACAELVRLVGIQRVVYGEKASCSHEGLLFLTACGVRVDKAKPTRYQDFLLFQSGSFV